MNRANRQILPSLRDFMGTRPVSNAVAFRRRGDDWHCGAAKSAPTLHHNAAVNKRGRDHAEHIHAK
jgi:hypothetical protein